MPVRGSIGRVAGVQSGFACALRACFAIGDAEA